MMETFVAIMLTVNAAKLDQYELMPGLHATRGHCQAHVVMERKKHKGARFACIPLVHYRQRRDETFK